MTTYNISKTLAPNEAYITPSTADATDTQIFITITTTKDTYVLPQYSEDSGATWTDHADGKYHINATTDKRTITIPNLGLVRLAIGNNTASANTLTIEIVLSTLTSGGVSPEDVYRAGGISSSVISRADTISAILRAESEGRQMTGRPLTTETATEEQWGNNKNSLFLYNSPIVSLDTLTIGGTSITTTYVDVVKATGQITLMTTAEAARFTLPQSQAPTQFDRNISITYTWGFSTAEYWYLRLVECLAAIMILTQQTGGTYDDITSYTIGDVTASVGEPWTNINRTVMNLKEEIKSIMKNVKKAIAVF